MNKLRSKKIKLRKGLNGIPINCLLYRKENKYK